MTIGDIVGRNHELAAVDRFLDRLGDGPAAVVFAGEPGIGKTTVWRHAVERAAERSWTVLSCRPVEAETTLAFVSLADLLEPVADAILPDLPEPQRVALAVALMREAPPGKAPSARAVATAVLSTLRIVAAASPVVIAIDDQQWLDRASAEALAFALRRIRDLRVGVAAAVRIGDGSADLLALDRTLLGGIERVALGPLTLGALHHVIRTHLDHAFPRPTLRRIDEASAGNPFFALEIARSLIEAGTQPGPGEPLPVPGTLASLVVRRLERLPQRTRDVLRVVAALPVPTAPLVRTAAGDRVDAELARAEAARVIEVQGDRLRFTHPLLASAVYASASADQRRELHRRLGAVVAEPEERARHLALAASKRDESVARALDEAALRAWRRGAPDAAGELQERAAHLTPDREGPLAWRRLVQAAEHFVHGGDHARAVTLLNAVLAGPVAGDARARAWRLLGQIHGQERSFGEAAASLAEALTHATDAALRAAIKIELSNASFSAGDVRRAAAVGTEALADAERLGDPGLLADALCLVVVGKLLRGIGPDHANLERALALEDRGRAGPLELRPTALAGIVAIWDGRLAEGHALLREMCEWAATRGEESGLSFLLSNRSWLEWWRGDYAAAVACADEARVIAEQSGSETMRGVALMQRGRARAGCGDLTAARADLAAARVLLDQAGYVQGMPWLMAGEATLALSLDAVEPAARAVEPLVALAESVGGVFLDFASDAIEALARSGQLERAAALLARFTDRATRLARPWALASARRGRGVVAAAKGDLDTALAEAEAAVAAWEPLEMPVELARALLLLGQVRRRRGERRMARTALQRARAVFERTGAARWTDRAMDELGRIPIRRAAGRDLTETEERVAALAATGRTNAEVAHTLFMSPKTVEANLTRIYDKLGIHSRAELGARMLERRAKGPPPK